MDLENVLRELAEMRRYFAECRDHAADGSKAQKQFGDYVLTLAEVSWMIRDKIREGQA
jgi:hypothetical protein